MKIRLLTIGFMLTSTFFISYGQTTQEKILAIANKLSLIESPKEDYEFQLEYLKPKASGNDSIKIIELGKKISEEEIIKRVSEGFKKAYSNEEINLIYDFMKTSAYEKFFNSKEAYNVIISQFKDIDKEIKEMTQRLNEPIEKPTNKFKPIPVDKEDGFYATVEKEINLEDSPALTSKDFKKIKKIYNSNDNRPEISIELTKNGAKKFYILTRENIGKPIAIVIAKQIVYMPIVYGEITNGKTLISGDFSEEEIDKMIELLE